MKEKYHSASVAEGHWYVNELSVYMCVRFICLWQVKHWCIDQT